MGEWPQYAHDNNKTVLFTTSLVSSHPRFTKSHLSIDVLKEEGIATRTHSEVLTQYGTSTSKDVGLTREVQVYVPYFETNYLLRSEYKQIC